jgi:multisubunit Na+/H+ antiporter MnhB subunit
MERTVSAIFSFIVFFVGLAFVLARPFSAGRLLIGLMLMAVSLAVLYLAFRRKDSVVIEQKIDIGGAVNPKLLKCRNCGAGLSRSDISVRAGAVFTSCPYCHSEYQIEEEPKW